MYSILSTENFALDLGIEAELVVMTGSALISDIVGLSHCTFSYPLHPFLIATPITGCLRSKRFLSIFQAVRSSEQTSVLGESKKRRRRGKGGQERSRFLSHSLSLLLIFCNHWQFRSLRVLLSTCGALCRLSPPFIFSLLTF